MGAGAAQLAYGAAQCAGVAEGAQGGGVAMSGETCQSCMYWIRFVHEPDDDTAKGWCARYPQHVGVCALHWCGEWVQREPDPWEREP